MLRIGLKRALFQNLVDMCIKSSWLGDGPLRVVIRLVVSYDRITAYLKWNRKLLKSLFYFFLSHILIRAFLHFFPTVKSRIATYVICF